jgi:hypothetical protein
MTKILHTIALELARVLLKLAMDRALRKELPAIYKALDLQIPFLLINRAGAAEVKATVTDIIEEKIGHKATATQVSAILGLYDPVKAALRSIRK